MIQKFQHAVVGLGLSFALGCAGSNVTQMQSAPSERIAKPDVVLIYDFAVGADDVVVDTLGSEFKSESSQWSKEEETAHATAASLSEQLVAKLNAHGIPAQHADGQSRPPLNAILLKGQFLSIDKGSRVKRMVIGFGAGSSELQVRVQAYQATQYGLQRLAEAEVDSHGTRMPGMAVPMVGGAAAGTMAASAVISGGMNIIKETKGAMYDDAGRVADEISDRAVAFYQRQGWL